MKVLGVSGSARKNGNTTLMIREVFKVLEEEGIETRLVELAGTHPRGCVACYQCFKRKDLRCAQDKDVINGIIAEMLEADGIILGSPTYFADISTEMKALIDRAGMVARANGDMFRRKPAAAVIARRRGGAIHAFDTINHLFTIGQMIIVGSSYWNVGAGREPGEVADDGEGMATMRTLGANMAWLLKKIAGED